MWVKIYYFMRVFRSFAHLITTIMSVIRDMQVFMIILSMSIFGFSGCFFILGRNNDREKPFITSVMMVYELMLGAFDTTTYGSIGFPLIYMVFVIAALFLIVIMLNLLIAIISDTFAEVQDKKE